MKTRILILLYFMCVLLYGTDYTTAIEVSAKNAHYQFLNVGETSVKTGKYYLKCSIKDGREHVYISKKKNSAYKKTPLTKHLCSNGKQVYYAENGGTESYLYKYNLSSGKKTKVKKLGSGEIYWSVSAVYKDNIYLTKSDEFGLFRDDTYMYSIKKKNLSELKKSCEIIDSYGKYAISCDKLRSDITPYPISLWKLTSSGMKKITRLVKCGAIPSGSTVFIKKKIYYVDYLSTANNRTAVLYQCNMRGSNKKKIATFKTSDANGVFIYDVTEKDCIVYMKGQYYKYTYKSGNMKKYEKK